MGRQLMSLCLSSLELPAPALCFQSPPDLGAGTQPQRMLTSGRFLLMAPRPGRPLPGQATLLLLTQWRLGMLANIYGPKLRPLMLLALLQLTLLPHHK